VRVIADADRLELSTLERGGSVARLGALIHDRFTSAISHGGSLERTRRRQRKRIRATVRNFIEGGESGRENSSGSARYARYTSSGPSLIIIATRWPTRDLHLGGICSLCRVHDSRPLIRIALLPARPRDMGISALTFVGNNGDARAPASRKRDSTREPPYR